MKNNLAVLVLILAISATVIQLIGVAIPYWFSKETDGGTVSVTITTKTYSGLFQYCTETKYSEQASDGCDSITSVDTAGLRAVQAMEIIGLSLLVGVIVCVIMKLACFQEKKLLSIVVGLMAIFAGVFIILGPIIYATDVKGDLNFSASDLHAGFALVVIAAIVAIVTGALSFFM